MFCRRGMPKLTVDLFCKAPRLLMLLQEFGSISVRQKFLRANNLSSGLRKYPSSGSLLPLEAQPEEILHRMRFFVSVTRERAYFVYYLIAPGIPPSITMVCPVTEREVTKENVCSAISSG